MDMGTEGGGGRGYLQVIGLTKRWTNPPNQFLDEKRLGMLMTAGLGVLEELRDAIFKWS
jgi:hypothetical protein